MLQEMEYSDHLEPSIPPDPLSIHVHLEQHSIPYPPCTVMHNYWNLIKFK